MTPLYPLNQECLQTHASGPLLVARWLATPTRPAADQLLKLLQERQRTETRVALVVVMSLRSGLPPPELLDYVARGLRRLDGGMLAMVTVLEDPGFWAASLRSLLIALKHLTRPSYPQHVTGSLEETARWLSARLPTPLDQTGPLLEHLRRP